MRGNGVGISTLARGAEDGREHSFDQLEDVVRFDERSFDVDLA